MAKPRYRESLIRRWVLHYAIVIMCIAVLFNWLFFYRIQSVNYNMAAEYLLARSTVITNFLNAYQINVDAYSDSFSKKLKENLGERQNFELQILDLQGKVLKSSQLVKVNYLIPFEGGKNPSRWIGKNALSGEKILVVTVPVQKGDEITAYVRCLTSLSELDGKINGYVAPVQLATLLVIILIFLLSLVFIKSVKKPIDSIVLHASKMASGEYQRDIPIDKNDELGHLAETLNFMNSEIVRHQKIRNMFISDISHEIKTPLTAISGWTELLMDYENTDAETIQKGLSAIQRETERLDKMVKTLLDYSRIEQSDFKLYTTEFDLVLLLEEVVEIYKGRMEKLGISYSLSISERPILIEADRERLFQSFINLIDNAVKFRRAECPQIQIFVEKEKNNLHIQVWDNGIGVKEEDQLHIFEKFYRGDGKVQGNGLGLSIVKKVIETHGGTIDVQSELGKYTAFHISFNKKLGKNYLNEKIRE